MFAMTIANLRSLRLAIALSMGCLLPGGLARAQEARFSNMKSAMEALAKDISKQMTQRGVDNLAIREFSGPSGASASSRIAQALTEQLSALTPKVNTTTSPGSWSVAGNFSVDKNEANGNAEIFIESTLKDPKGRTSATLITPIITNESETLTMFGVTATLPTSVPPGATNVDGSPKTVAEARADATLAAIDSPKVAIEKALVKAAPASPFAVELLINGQPVPPVVEGGAAFVNIPKGAEYEIRLVNNSGKPAGVTLTIDGISSLSFSPRFKAIGKWVVLPGAPNIIKGWLFDDKPARRFKVMDYGESAAAQFASTKDIGTITAVFCEAFEPGKLPPEQQKLLATRDQLATGLGAEVDFRAKPVSFQFGADVTAISIRYAKPDESDLPPLEGTPPTSPPVLAK
jgi:hypothetical protein